MAIIKWMCTNCGIVKNSSSRPLPGNCKRMPLGNGKFKPHRWVRR